MHPVAAWLLSLMVWLAPPEKLAKLPAYPGWEETAEQRLERYESIAQDIYAVAFDPANKPLYSGKRARVATAATMLAVSYKESGWARDVDLGPCYRGRDGKGMRCDGGLSACLLQIRIGAGKTPEGWTQEDLFADRRKCLTSGLRMMKRSFRACAKQGPDYWLNAYASGVCGLGHAKSKDRLGLARRMLERKAPLD